MGVNSLLSIGTHALNAHQMAIGVTGNNVANVDTIGYSRQSVRYEAFAPMKTRGGELGMGAYVAEVYRNFDQFAEKAYLGRFTQQQRWATQERCLSPAENLFNESNRIGVNGYMDMFFQDWEDLTQRPNDSATREALLSDAENLARMMRDTQDSLGMLQKEMDMNIQQSVDEVNRILEALLEINQQIMYNKTPTNNPNSLYDKRDQLIRELSTHIDIEVQQRPQNYLQDGYLTVQTTSGLPLLDGESIFKLEVRDGTIERALMPNSQYTGTVEVAGIDGFEYTLEIVKAGDMSATPPDMPEFRVSLDGGKTWLKDEDGRELHVPLEGPEDPSNLGGPSRTIKVKDIEITFTSCQNFGVGDKFTIMPKTGLYWVKPTREALNITPQTLGDGTDNSRRVVGGQLAAYFTVRDQNVAKYMDRMDALANAMIWETNYAHSQGAGNVMLTGTLGSYDVVDRTSALGLSSTGLHFHDKLKAGNVNFSMYDNQGTFMQTVALDFSFVAPPGVANFDPSVHSLDDVATAINGLTFTDANGVNHSMQATIIDGRLMVNSPGGNSFAISDDTAGLMAGLGINTFFTGTGAGNIGIKEDLLQNPDLIAHGKVNANGEVAEGDNATAQAIAGLATEPVKISTVWENTTASLKNYHATIVSGAGSDMRTARFNNDYNTTLSNELDERVSSVSGVNLDEEMTNLIKFQHSYTAAAKLITTADQMLQTLLSLKQ